MNLVDAVSIIIIIITLSFISDIYLQSFPFPVK